MNISPLITSVVQHFSATSVNNCPETAAQTPQISALVPTNIRVERIQTLGSAKIPQIIYTTPKGRCSTLLSKAKFRQIWQCWLQIRHPQMGQIQRVQIKPSSLLLSTEQGNIWISSSEAKAFLSRYNRVAIEPLFVKFNDTDTVVWNPVHQSLSQVSETGCSCADSQYRHRVCKHQIAAELCRINSNRLELLKSRSELTRSEEL